MITACFFLSAKNSCIIEQSKIEALSRQLKVLTEEKKEAEDKDLALSRVKKFVNKAGSLKLTSPNWAVDRIDLDQEVTFLELEQILSQCANSPDYYFKPSLLKITVPERSRENSAKLTLKLRGTFLTSLN